MNVLVCGSRDIDEKSVVYDAIASAPWNIEVLIHGDATGVDTIADRYARTRGIERDVHPIPDWVWDKIGPKSGPMRNGYMVEQADAVVAVWDGESSGTADTIKQAESHGLPVYKVVCGYNSGWGIEDTQLIEDDQKCLGDF